MDTGAHEHYRSVITKQRETIENLEQKVKALEQKVIDMAIDKERQRAMMVS